MLETTYRRLRAAAVVIAIVVATVVVSTVSVDLGPTLRARAEREGSKWLDRPMHIGRLGVEIGRGRFVIEDLRIEGLTPDARPWLVAKHISVSLTWGALWDREILIDTVEMSDWRMVVESFANGRHNWPRLNGPPRAPRTAPRPRGYDAAVRARDARRVRVRRLWFRWGVVAPQPRGHRGKAGRVSRERRSSAAARFISRISSRCPPTCSTTFKVQGGRIVLDRIQLTTDGAESALTGVVDTTRWPEMFYQVKSKVQFPRMREIFFARDTFSLHGEGDFTGTFHLFKGGRELKGNFFSREAGHQPLSVP